jgi:hypothetical protein
MKHQAPRGHHATKTAHGAMGKDAMLASGLATLRLDPQF